VRLPGQAEIRFLPIEQMIAPLSLDHLFPGFCRRRAKAFFSAGLREQ